MHPPPGFSLAQSEFNDFLFEFVVDEKDGHFLTVISDLARLDLNPWDEAARLAQLPRAGAIDELTAVIRDQETGDWQPTDPRSIAHAWWTTCPNTARPRPTPGRRASPKPGSQNRPPGKF